MRNKAKGTEAESVRPMRVLVANLLLVVTLLVLFEVGVLMVVQVDFSETDHEETARGMFVPLISLLVIVGMLLLKIARMRHEHAAELTLHDKQLELEREQSEQLAVADERAQIAQEIHDIVVHSLTVITTVSDGAVTAVDKNPDLTKTTLKIMSEVGRNTPSETRRLVGALRTPSETPTGLSASPEPSQTSSLEEVRFTPTPDLGEIDGLISQFRAAGLPISYEISDGEVPTDDPLQLTIYRIVQESLTSILRHTPSSTTVEVRLEVSCNGVEISMYSATSLAGISPRGGKGLVEMREHASVCDGRVTTGPTPSGWRVSATLHWEAQCENKAETWIIPS